MDYQNEAKLRWGETAAYKEYEKRNLSKERELSAGQMLMNLFAETGKIKHLSPDSEEAQSAVLKLKNFINENFYTCNNEILKGLGKIYTADGRFKENIDAAGGTGTAEFISRAIEVFVK